MCLKILKNSTFFQTIFKLDQILAYELHKKGCFSCGGKLDRANYFRKPRGGPPELPHELNRAFSFCCRQVGCRKRHRVPSTRFLGRSSFFSLYVVLVTCFYQGISSKRLSFAISHGISLKTLKRWILWWQSKFTSSPFWKAKNALFPSSCSGSNLPKDMWLSFQINNPDGEAEEKLLLFLAFWPKAEVHSL